MKYGIKHTAGAVVAITKFENDFIPHGFIEITYAKYTKFVSDMKANPFSTYDAGSNTLVADVVKLSDAQDQQLKKSLRAQLLILSNELDLQVRMGESTTATQASFDALKNDYEAL